MMIKLNKKLALGIRAQIKQQVKMKIENGELDHGQAVPSVRDLSLALNVNRNTVALAYRELIAEGVLAAEPGAGTFVRDNKSRGVRKELHRIIGESVGRAYELGFGLGEITESFFNCLASLPGDPTGGAVLVVERTEPAIEYLCRKISDETGVAAEGTSLRELERDPQSLRARFSRCALVVCGFELLDALTALLPGIEEKTVGVILQPDIKILNTMRQMPHTATVGYLCADKCSAERIFDSALFSGHRRYNRVFGGVEDFLAGRRPLVGCDIIFATSFALDHCDIVARPGQQIVRVDIVVEASGLEYIRERMAAAVAGDKSRRERLGDNRDEAERVPV